MSARFEHRFSCSPGKKRTSHQPTVRQTDFPFHVMDSTTKDCEARPEKPDLKRSVLPAAEPWTRL